MLLQTFSYTPSHYNHNDNGRRFSITSTTLVAVCFVVMLLMWNGVYYKFDKIRCTSIQSYVESAKAHNSLCTQSGLREKKPLWRQKYIWNFFFCVYLCLPKVCRALKWIDFFGISRSAFLVFALNFNQWFVIYLI